MKVSKPGDEVGDEFSFPLFGGQREIGMDF